MRRIAVAGVVGAKNRRSIAATIRLISRFRFLANAECGQVIIDRLDGIGEAVKQVLKQLMGAHGMLQKRFLIIAPVAQAGANVDAHALVGTLGIVRIADQPPVDKTLDQALGMRWIVSLAQHNGGDLRFGQRP